MPRPSKGVGKGRLSPEKIAENRERAAREGSELDRAGKVKTSPFAGCVEEEEQLWSNPEDRSETMLVWRRVPPDDKRCRGTVRSEQSPWKGNRCISFAIHGGTVCQAHGGRLPNVKKAAQMRLAMAAIPAADRLIYMALRKRNMSDGDRLRALGMILDRAGIEGKSTVEIEVKPWQDALQSLFARTNPDGAPGLPTAAIVEEDDGADTSPEWTPEGDDDDE